MRSFRRLLGHLVLCGLLLLSSYASAQGADLTSASDADKATASEHYTQGMAAFEAGDAAAALTQFEQSYQAVRSPNSHLMVGKALIDLGRYVDAHSVLSETLQEASEAEAVDAKYAQTRLAAEEELTRVEQQVVMVSVTLSGASTDSKVRINGKEYAPSELDAAIALAPGPIEVVLVDDGNAVATQSLTGSPGETLNVSLTPTPEEEAIDGAPTDSTTVSAEKKPFRHRRATAYVAAGLGAAGAITFGVFGLLNNAKYSGVEDECDNNICPASARSDAERGHTYQTAANVGLIVGVVGLGTALTLILTEDDSEPPETATRLGVGPGQISLQGTF